MELGWLEDLIELAAVRNFSTAAAVRRVTQPAFSRRIRALENWVGTDLIDRSSYPVSMTQAGERFLESARDLTCEIYRLRDECRRKATAGTEILSFSAQHTIALNIFPEFLRAIEERCGHFIIRLEATDFHDCVEAIALGRCDFALCYTHPLGPPVLQTAQFASRRIGNDPFRLVTPCDADGMPLYGREQMAGGAPLPLVSYSSDCFLGQLQTSLRGRLRSAGTEFETVYENSMSEAVKRMVIVGKGVGWLPLSSAMPEIASGRLAVVELEQPQVDLDVMVFRKVGTASAVVERFWSNVEG